MVRTETSIVCIICTGVVIIFTNGNVVGAVTKLRTRERHVININRHVKDKNKGLVV